MSDLIEREDALNALLQCAKHCIDPLDSYHIDIEDSEARIRRVPSAYSDLDEWCIDCKEYDQERHCCPRWNRVIWETLKDVPERKTGKWLRIGHWGRSYKCNRCGNFLDFDGVNAGRGDANFCPNCGADMRGEGDG